MESSLRLVTDDSYAEYVSEEKLEMKDSNLDLLKLMKRLK
jgi:hypothetical protein